MFFLVFFIIFRETVEVSIIVSVLLSWQKKTLGPSDNPRTHKKLRHQVSRVVNASMCERAE